MLSVRAKEAIKIALAMTIAYAIALWMDWDKPYWAAFAIAVISLSSLWLRLATLKRSDSLYNCLPPLDGLRLRISSTAAAPKGYSVATSSTLSSSSKRRG